MVEDSYLQDPWKNNFMFRPTTGSWQRAREAILAGRGSHGCFFSVDLMICETSLAASRAATSGEPGRQWKGLCSSDLGQSIKR
jgi:hypothetical protein